MSFSRIAENSLKPIIKKIQLQQLNYLLSLPYIKLLGQLSQRFNRLPSPIKPLASSQTRHISMQKKLIMLSAHHECSYLYQLGINSNTSLAERSTVSEAIDSSTGVVSPNISSQLLTITKQGLASLFQLSNPNDKSQTSSRLMKMMKYMQKVRQFATQSHNFPTYAQSINEIKAFWLPTICNVEGMNMKQKQILKQQYLLTINDVFSNIYSENQSNHNGLHVTELFPFQFFNYTDQPLIREIFQKHLYHRIQTASPTKAIVWLSRFGLTCDAYLNRWVKNKAKQLHESDLNLCNSLYVISRKILGASAIKPTTTQAKLYDSIRSTIKKMKSFQMISAISSELKQQPSAAVDSLIQKFIAQIYNSAFTQQLQQQQRIGNLKNKLSQNMAIKYTEQNQLGKKDTIGRVIQYKIIRMLLLYLHMNLVEESTSKDITKAIKLILNYPLIRQHISRVILIGDLAAELAFADQAYYLVHGAHLFQRSSPNFHLINTQNKKFLNTIRQIQGNQLLISSDELNEGLWSRRNCVQHLLSGSSQMLYASNSIFGIIPNKNKNLTLKSLLNDNQYLSNHPTCALANLLQSKLEQNLQLTVTAEKLSHYPFFPALKVVDRNQQCKLIYARDSLVQHRRIKFSEPHKVVNISQVGGIKNVLQQYANS